MPQAIAVDFLAIELEEGLTDEHGEVEGCVREVALPLGHKQGMGVGELGHYLLLHFPKLNHKLLAKHDILKQKARERSPACFEVLYLCMQPITMLVINNLGGEDSLVGL